MNEAAPSIERKSFICPHCNANSQQYWLKVYAQYVDKPELLNQKALNKSMKKLTSDLLCNLVADGKEEEIADITRAVYEYHKDEISELHGNILKGSKVTTHKSIEIKNLHISQCYSCGKLSIWKHTNLLFPSTKPLQPPNEDLPEDIKKTYEEAREIFNASPRASSALLRLCIEMLCDHLKCKGKTLANKINDLFQKGLDNRLIDAMTSVRLLGNEVVHNSKQMIIEDSPEIAQQLFRIVNLVSERLISAEKHLEEFSQSMPESHKKKIEASKSKLNKE